jgi:dual specificity tyrosine-phosphorylation-regulated kinase 2/3/4
MDHKTGRMGAMKVLKNLPKIREQTKTEAGLLQYLRKEDPSCTSGCVRMHYYSEWRSHPVILFDLHSHDIYEFMQKNNRKALSMKLIKRLSAQLLVSLDFLHKRKLIHCDLKPENVLLKDKNKSDICIIDFGSACFDHEQIYNYIQSRHYRAPEVVLSTAPYGTGIDVWSAACVIAELQLARKPLFDGESALEMLRKFGQIEELGALPSEMAAKSNLPKPHEVFLPRASVDAPWVLKGIVDGRGREMYVPSSLRLADALDTNDTQFVDFLARLLVWDPARRPSAAEAMQHPWIKSEVEQLRKANATK